MSNIDNNKNIPSLKAMEDLCGKDELVNIFTDLITKGSDADPFSKNVPSSVGQLRLGARITAALRNMGYEATQDEKGVVTCHVEASKGSETAPKLALLAHMDTAPDAKGENVQPHLVENYQGGAITLKSKLVLDESVSPELSNHIGDDIIVTSGDTLLGADDKAGVAVILQILRKISQDPEIPHPPMCAVFTVDEEIGYSADYVDLDKIKCDYGVTIDGGEAGELATETFNAEAANIYITGRSVHTGTAYKVMINACELASRFIAMLPPDEKPENTCGKEGFYHVHGVYAKTAEAEIRMILRDFTQEGLLRRAKMIDDIAALLNSEAGFDAVKVEHIEQYKNMAKVLTDHPQIVDLCKKAYEIAGVPVRLVSVRGGTDGSNLSNRGLPCPNIFTGALNCHGPLECLPVTSLHKAYAVTRALVECAALAVR